MTRKEYIEKRIAFLLPQKDDPGVRAGIIDKFKTTTHWVDSKSPNFKCFDECPGCIATETALGVYGNDFFRFPEVNA